VDLLHSRKKYVENHLLEVLSHNTEPTYLHPRSFYLHIFPLRYSLTCVSNLAFFSIVDLKVTSIQKFTYIVIFYKNCFFFCRVFPCLPAKSYDSLLKSSSRTCPRITNRTADVHHRYYINVPAFCIFKIRRSTCETYTVSAFL
jgi:hypothetical protein